MRYLWVLGVLALVVLAACGKSEISAEDKLNALTARATVEHKQVLEGIGIPEKPEVEIGNKKGMKAPDFTVTTLTGESYTLSEKLKEKPQIIEFFATWCPYCKKDFNVLKDVRPDYEDDVGYIAIDMDLTENAKLIQVYADQSGFDFDFAPGKKSILRDYSIRYTTTKFAIGTDGIIKWTGSGEMDANRWHVLFKGLKGS